MNYIPVTDLEKEAMLKEIGISSIDELFRDIPEDLRFKGDLKLPKGLSEYETRKALIKLAKKNTDMNELANFMGAGAYNHYVPTLVDHLLSRSEFYTAYTPYQPEISQGTLQNIYEFQTIVCELFGMDVSNASVYDGATAVAEAMVMACDKKKTEIVVSMGLHKEYRETVETYAHGMGFTIKYAELKDGITPVEAFEAQATDATAAFVVMYPNFYGCIEDVQKIAESAHAKNALLIVSVSDLSAMGILEAPGNLGADIVVGDGMPFAGPLSFSGPSIGLIATTTKLSRKLPGRICGITEDTEGKRAFVLTMQAREQHIRREKASSNICSNQALYALANNITLSTLGKYGLQEMAENTLTNAHYCKDKLLEIDGVEMLYDQPFYSEFAVKLPIPARVLQKHLLKHDILGPVDMGIFEDELANVGLFFVSEIRSKDDMDRLATAVEVIINEQRFI
ncbi:MAG: aminomethyl-transferring glycine dehydrogenase subunit GcvPA [Firmicutes bacterium]|nr:aminomethyl-transferring glycine dehydrogenase subunit GcvPA [Bacillota bacterium]